MLGRHGIWKCPNCKKHQIWKVRSKSTVKLDRRCIACDERIRVTLDRSSTGQGRKESVELWERSLKVEEDALRREIEIRDSEERDSILRPERGGSKISVSYTHLTLPTILRV